MPFVNHAVPDVQVLLALDPGDIARVLLPLVLEAQKENSGRHFHSQAIVALHDGQDAPTGAARYPMSRKDDVDRALVEGWQWLRANLLVVPSDMTTNGANGWMRLSRRGLSIAESGGFDDYRKSAAFPKELLHASIADKVWIELARGM